MSEQGSREAGEWNVSELPRRNHIVEGLRMGTLANIIGIEAAEEFFSEPDPEEEARRAAEIRRRH